MDMKRRSIDAVRLLEICPRIDSCLTEKFDDMLWLLMKNAADKTHLSLEPWYSSLDPALAGFHPVEDDQEGDLFEETSDGSYVKAPSKSELREQKMKEDGIWNKLFSVVSATSSIDDKKAKGENICIVVVPHLTCNDLSNPHCRLLPRTSSGARKAACRGEEGLSSRK